MRPLFLPHKKISLFRLFILCVSFWSSLAYASCTEKDSAPIKFGSLTWESGQFISSVLQTITEDGYGCKTELVPGTGPALETALAQNDILEFAMSHIRLENVSKIFDAKPREINTVLKLLEEGMSSSDVRAQTGCSVGLYDVSLTIGVGELHCIMALSGSGKSTLVRHINRLIDPTEGKIWINSVNHYEGDNVEYLTATADPSPKTNEQIINVLSLNDKQLQHFRQNNVSMVFQHFGLVPHMTVIQNVAYGLRVKKMPKSKRYDLARHWLNEVGLEGVDSKYPDELSGGMKQRVGLARALAVDTPIRQSAVFPSRFVLKRSSA